MQINLPDDTIRDIEAFLASSGEKLDVTAFIDQSVRQSMLSGIVGKIHERNAAFDPHELDATIDEAVKSIREE